MPLVLSPLFTGAPSSRTVMSNANRPSIWLTPSRLALLPYGDVIASFKADVGHARVPFWLSKPYLARPALPGLLSLVPNPFWRPGSLCSTASPLALNWLRRHCPRTAPSWDLPLSDHRMQGPKPGSTVQPQNRTLLILSHEIVIRAAPSLRLRRIFSLPSTQALSFGGLLGVVGPLPKPSGVFSSSRSSTGVRSTPARPPSQLEPKHARQRREGGVPARVVHATARLA
ncbi:hypothetical protein LIA77_11341 [Sarocladium implicatum]|nr:hypothetical protein LIA77_11341 [Sarocladium implicatum]